MQLMSRDGKPSDKSSYKIQLDHIQGLLEEAKIENRIRNKEVADLTRENNALSEYVRNLKMEKGSLEATLELHEIKLQEEIESKENEVNTVSESEEIEKRKIGDAAFLNYLNQRAGALNKIIQTAQSGSP